MSSTTTDIEDAVSEFTSTVEPEVIDTVTAIDEAVDQAAVAADESMDVVMPVVDVVQSLTAGNRAVAIEAGISLLSDQTGDEAREAIGALKVLKADLATSIAEGRDVVREFDDAYAAVEDELSEWFEAF